MQLHIRVSPPVCPKSTNQMPLIAYFDNAANDMQLHIQVSPSAFDYKQTGPNDFLSSDFLSSLNFGPVTDI